MRTIAIVGAGFCGTALATRLLRAPPAAETRLVLIERQAEVGRGVAYAAHPYPYLLNVAAARMSADPAQPLEFLAFARQRDAGAAPGDFLPRALYGEYLAARLDEAERGAPAHMRLERLHAEVTAIGRDGGAWRIETATGGQLTAADVVLALGNPRPATPAAWRGIDDASDLWDEAGEIPGDHAVLIVGTALTMVDTVLRLAADPARSAPIVAVSRHGLLPRPHGSGQDDRREGDIEKLRRAAGTSARALLRAVRAMIAQAQRHGRDWRDVIVFLRSEAPALWQALSQAERGRFLRHVRPYWGIHRNRVPAEFSALLETLQSTGRLTVRAARIVALERRDGRIRVTLAPRGGGSAETLLVDRVVNCTGPDYDLSRSREPLVRQLLRDRLVNADIHGLGLATGPVGEVLGESGAVPGLYYVGPMLRAGWWEATAVQELRGHVERLAVRLGDEAP